jgi:hypothetical protein
MSRILQPNPGLEDLFSGRFVKISKGAVTIDLLTGRVKFVATTTMDDAAKLSASYLYAAFESPKDFEGDPMWTNSINFCDESTVGEPAVIVVDDQLYLNTPPFSGDRNFWKLFTKYWAQNVLRGMSRALEGRDQTTKEKVLIDYYSTIKKDLPLQDR